MTYDALELLRDKRREALAEVSKIDALIAELEPEGRRYVTLKEFTEEPTEFDWLVGGLIARGTISMLVADPGLGKSTLMAQLTLSLAHGRSFLGGRVAGPTRVLMLAAEGARGAFKGRVLSAIRALGLPPSSAWEKWMIQAPTFTDFRIGGGGFERLVKESGAALVILDTLGYFAAFNENDSSEWKARVAAPLRALSAETGAGFILVHHQPKVTEANKDQRDGRGSSAMLADCDHFWRLDAVKGSPGLRDFVIRKNKYGSEVTVSLAFDGGNAIFRQTDETVTVAPAPVAPPNPKPVETWLPYSESEA